MLKRYLFLITLSFILFLACSEPDKNTSTNQEVVDTTPKWSTIYNGKDLDGWTMKIAESELGENFGNTFRVEDKILKIRYDAYGDDFNKRFGALYFKKPLSNYRLKLEYRFVGETAPGAPEWGYRDSGIQYHSQSPSSLATDQPFPVCLEYNFHGGNGTDERPVGAVCANGTSIEVNGKQNDSYCTAPSIEKTFHGDQWVTAEIDVTKDVIKHFVNGEEILSFTNPKYNPDHEIAGGLIKDGNLNLTSGYISIQSNSHPMDIRKIELLEY